MALPSPKPPMKRTGSGGHHFTWLLSTEREDDLDMVSDDDGDDAMVQLDEEYIGEMERKAALRDAENEAENDSDIDQLDEEDRIARSEYDDGRTLVSPRHTGDRQLSLDDRSSRQRYVPTCFERTMHHVPCTSCCFPLDGSHRKDCTTARISKKTKRYCAPNMELLRTLRVVKHVRIFQKILSGTSKASYYQSSESASRTDQAPPNTADIGLSEMDEESPSTVDTGSRNGINGGSESNSMEMDQLVTNEITGETTRRSTNFVASERAEVAVELDLESGSTRSTEPLRNERAQTGGLNAMSKPSWAMRKEAAFRRVQSLAKETLANVKPGLLTAFVNFPLVLAVAGGVGAHPYFGLNAAFWAALTATLFGGSRYTIAAPTMLLTANLVETVSTYGTFVLPIIALLSAIMVYIMIFTRAIEFITFVPSMTTHGVTLGTTALVIIYQLKFALGLPVTIHVSSVPYYILELIKASFIATNWRAVVMFSVSIIIAYIVIRWGRGLNVGFVLVPLGIFTGWLLDFTLKNQAMPVPYIETLGTRYGHVEFHPFLLNHWQSALFNWTVVGKSMEIAFICVMESYATANLTFEITGKRFSKNHEMFALATGNFISGIFGGMPTSVGVTRTLLNIRSGATSRAAGLVNGLALLLFAITMTSWLRWFPLPVVAALQITSAWRSVNTAVWTKVWQEDRKAAATSLATAFLCVAIDPFIGLLIGIVLSMSIFSRQLSKGHSELTVKTRVHRIQVHRSQLGGSFIALPPFIPGPSSPTTPGSALSSTHVGSYSATPGSSTAPGPSGSASSPPEIPRLKLSSAGIPPRLRKLNLGASLTDLPASKTISIRNAVAQLQPLLGEDTGDSDREVNYNVVVYRISGVLTFINAQTHYETLKAIIKNHITCLILNVRFLYYLDYDGKSILQNLMEYIDSRLPLPSYLVGVTADLNKQLKKDAWYKKKSKENLIWKLESDAFKDIQRRNAELIEAEATENPEAGPSSIAPSTSGMVNSPSGGSLHPTSVDPIIDTPTFAASRRLNSSNSNLQRTNSATRISPNASLTTLPPFVRQSSGSLAGAVGAGNLSPSSSSSPAPVFEHSAPGLVRSPSKGKPSFVSRHTTIGAEMPRSPMPQHYHQLSVLPSERPLDLVTTEELMQAISAAARDQGLDPDMAIANTEAYIRANRAHRGGGGGTGYPDSEGGLTEGGGYPSSSAASVSAPPFSLSAVSSSSSTVLSSPPAGVGRRVSLMNSTEVPVKQSTSVAPTPSIATSSRPPRTRFRVTQPVSSTPFVTPIPSEEDMPHSASSIERIESGSSYSSATQASSSERTRFQRRNGGVALQRQLSASADFAEDELSDGSDSHHSDASSSSNSSSSSGGDDQDQSIVDGHYSDDHYLTSPEDVERRQAGIPPRTASPTSAPRRYSSALGAPTHSLSLNDIPNVTVTSSTEIVLPKPSSPAHNPGSGSDEDA